MYKIEKYEGNQKRIAKIVESTEKQELETSRQVGIIGVNINVYNENKSTS